MALVSQVAPSGRTRKRRSSRHRVRGPARFLGGSTVAFIQLAVARVAEYGATALNVFFPLPGQLLPGGGSSPNQCEDGEDNDGDGKTDYPGCTSPTDDSEAG